LRLKVKYRLFNRVGERIVPEKYDSYSIIFVEETEDEDELYRRVKLELSREIGRPSNDFKILGYSEV
jgi:tRNA A22 N-methylase